MKLFYKLVEFTTVFFIYSIGLVFGLLVLALFTIGLIASWNFILGGF